jgi:chromosomal replication initiator protein
MWISYLKGNFKCTQKACRTPLLQRYIFLPYFQKEIFAMNDVIAPVDLELLWGECLKILEKSLGRPAFETCLKDTKLLSIEKNILSIGVSSWAKNYLKEKRHYKELIIETLYNLTGKKYTLHIMATNNGSPLPAETIEVTLPEPANSKKDFFSFHHASNTLKPNYTFDTFVVGEGNRFASAACRAVSESPGATYNPLLIYGGVGLGKTHLLQAIGSNVINNNRKYKVVYVSMENFANEFINSILNKNLSQFHEKYRTVDVLLIDDIQFLIKKEGFQDTFFHTFNDLHNINKQIVLTSDRPPKEFTTLSDRLRSRFEWGLMADIQPPDIETREAILRKKAETENIHIPSEVMAYIAEKIPSNIRELEGALTTVIAYASLTKKDITKELAVEAIRNILRDTKEKHLTPEIIQRKVSEYFGIKQSDLTGQRRDRRFSNPRQIAMYFTRELTDLSFPDIAKAFSKGDHSTVLHAYNKVSALLDDPSTKNTVENVRNLLKEH